MATYGRQIQILIAALVVIVALAGALLLVLELPTQAQEGAPEETPTATEDDFSVPDVEPAEANAQPETGVDEDPEGNPYVSGELLVAYKEGTSQATQDEIDWIYGAETLDTFPGIDSRLLSFPEIKSEQSKEAREQALEQKKQELEQNPNVEAVGYNYIRQALQEA